MVNADFICDKLNYHIMPKTFKVPAHIDGDAPFLGLLGDTARARVIDYLIAVEAAATISEIARAVDLSRLSTRSALRALESWGAVESQSIEGGWRRYRVRIGSPIVTALQLLMGAINDAQEPGHGIFGKYAEALVGVRVVPVGRSPRRAMAPAGAKRR
jgi:DNA-binding transcriptional ArsR family regulator